MNATTGMDAATASWIYLAVLLWPIICLTVLHWRGRIDLLTTITTTKDAKEYVDGKKLAFVAGFAVGAIAFAYLAVTDRFTEWYATLFFLYCLGGKAIGDREQRLNKALDVPKVAAGVP